MEGLASGLSVSNGSPARDRIRGGSGGSGDHWGTRGWKSNCDGISTRLLRPTGRGRIPARPEEKPRVRDRMQRRACAASAAWHRRAMVKRPESRLPGPPPDAASLHEAFVRHLARYAATRAGLLRVLERRIARWERAASDDGGHASVEGTQDAGLGRDADAIAAAAAAARQAARSV